MTGSSSVGKIIIKNNHKLKLFQINRVCVTVLRNMLLKQLDNGAFEPKKLKRDKAKGVLLLFRRNLQKNARSDCIESSMITFDYV